MADQPILRDKHRTATMPQFIDEPAADSRPTEKKLSYWASLDKPLVLIVGLLLVLGSGMVFSTTFNWSLVDYGSSTAIFLQFHLRNVLLAIGACTIFAVVDYRFWRRFAPFVLLITFGALVAVNIFGDDTFGARRSLIGGSLQPGELAEFAMVFYMAAWLGAKRTKADSFLFGLIPFMVLLGIVLTPIAIQPDLSTLAIIILTTGAMFFVAGARIWHLVTIGIASIIIGIVAVQTFPYAQTRVDSYIASLSDPTQANPHTQQIITAFVTGGWFGKGLGQGTQKFNNALPAPHTDSIFAVIGEELGVIGAAFVVLMFAAFVIRGVQVSRRAVDPFGALLAIGFTLLVAVQALLNIAVMTAIIPTSGLPLPFISYGGSALIVTMIGVGLLLSVSRVAAMRENAPQRRQNGANPDRGWGDGRSRLPRTGSRRSSSQVSRRA
jgi:cell division protein FtsW